MPESKERNPEKLPNPTPPSVILSIYKITWVVIAAFFATAALSKVGFFQGLTRAAHHLDLP